MSPTCDVCGDEFRHTRGLEQHIGIAHDNPWQDEEVLRELHQERRLNHHQIADLLGCSNHTVGRWIDRFGIITPVSFSTSQDKGYESWNCKEGRVFVHRLLAVAEYGIEEVSDKIVHHKNGIPWDNRSENIEVLPKSEHHTEHRKAQGKQRKAIAYAYEFTDMSSYDVAETCDYSQGSVLRIHREFFS